MFIYYSLVTGGLLLLAAYLLQFSMMPALGMAIVGSPLIAGFVVHRQR
jgi:hypothetical protein